MDGRLKASSVTAIALSALVTSVTSAFVLVACATGGNDGDDTVGGGGTVDAASIKDDSGAKSALPGQDSGTSSSSSSSSSSSGGDGGGNTDGGNTNIPPACATALTTASYDFESGDQGWTHAVSDGADGAATWPFDPWTRGTPSGSGTSIACPNGQCFGAELSQNYAQCQRGELISPSIDLSACKAQSVTLVFDHAYDFWSNATWTDGGTIEISSDGGGTWNVPTATYPGTVKINPSLPGGYDCVLPDQFHVNNKSGFVKSQSKTTMQIDIPAASITNQMKIRFSQASGVSSQNSDPDSSRPLTAAGWRIDNVHFTAK